MIKIEPMKKGTICLELYNSFSDSESENEDFNENFDFKKQNEKLTNVGSKRSSEAEPLNKIERYVIFLSFCKNKVNLKKNEIPSYI